MPYPKSNVLLKCSCNDVALSPFFFFASPVNIRYKKPERATLLQLVKMVQSDLQPTSFLIFLVFFYFLKLTTQYLNDIQQYVMYVSIVTDRSVQQQINHFLQLLLVKVHVQI